MKDSLQRTKNCEVIFEGHCRWAETENQRRDALQALANEDFSAAESLVTKHPHSHLAAAFRRVFPSITFHSQDQALSAVEVASVQRIIDLNTLEQLAKFRAVRKGLPALRAIIQMRGKPDGDDAKTWQQLLDAGANVSEQELDARIAGQKPDERELILEVVG
jgi:hypothetical protein